MGNAINTLKILKVIESCKTLEQYYITQNWARNIHNNLEDGLDIEVLLSLGHKRRELTYKLLKNKPNEELRKCPDTKNQEIALSQSSYL